MSLKIAYLSDGKLYYINGSSPAKELQSQFAQKAMERSLRNQKTNAWKSKKKSGSFLGGGQLWGVDPMDEMAVSQINVSTISRSKEDQIYYALESDTVGGLFLYNYSKEEEQRLFHRADFRVRDLSWNSEAERLTGCQVFPDGISNLIMMKEDGTDLRQLTEGDSIDESPSWAASPQDEPRIVYQSSGIARNDQGYFIGRGPAGIHSLDLRSNSLVPILENPKSDYLQPHFDSEGALYYIRRPYEEQGRQYSGTSFITDVLFFPFRLVRAFFNYLNFFSLMYSNKPLTTASGPKLQGDDQKTIILKGKAIDAQKALRQGLLNSEVPSLVPSSWVLVQRKNNVEKVLAKGVAAFDLGPDGSVVYTNGSGIFRISRDNGSELLSKGQLIEEVKIL